ncbi:MAG: amidohydrolase [Gemmatimonadales bacterium]
MTDRRTAGAALLLALLAGCAERSAPDEVLLVGAKIFTADTTAPWAEALLIRGERIAAVGDRPSVEAAASAGARRIDLGGRTVVPGFNDAHDHVSTALSGVSFAVVPDPLPDPPFESVADSLAALVARVEPGTWLRTTVGSRVLEDPMARRLMLDRVAPNHPVELRAWTGHGTILNSAGLRELGLSLAEPDPLGGGFERDASGALTGLLEEYAGYNAWKPSFGADAAAILAAFRARSEEVLPWGITSVQDMMTGMPPQLVASLLDSLDLDVRLRLIRMPGTSPEGRILEPWQALPTRDDSWVSVSGTKWVLDGTPVERLAVMRRPYSDRPGWHGRLNFESDTLRRILEDALAADEQPLLHAVGDSTIALALRLMGELAPDSVWQRLRPRIEHGEGLEPDLIPLARRLGVVVVQNPSHLALGPEAALRYGPERMPVLQPLASLLGAGIPVALGSDGPLNPFLNLMLAVLHPDNPSEALSMEQAVRAYTLGSAFAEHREHEKGALTVGRLADLAVLSQDIFSAPPPSLPGTTSVLTVVGGRARFDPQGLWEGGAAR